MTTVQKNPLGLIMNLVESLGLEVTYAYDNLVFVEHNAFLLQMDETPPGVQLFFNRDSTPALRAPLADDLVAKGRDQGLNIERKGLFALEPAEGETLKITFLD